MAQLGATLALACLCASQCDLALEVWTQVYAHRCARSHNAGGPVGCCDRGAPISTGYSMGKREGFISLHGRTLQEDLWDVAAEDEAQGVAEAFAWHLRTTVNPDTAPQVPSECSPSCNRNWIDELCIPVGPPSHNQMQRKGVTSWGIVLLRYIKD